MKERNMAYLMWALAFVGFAGVHRIYLGRYVSGAIYMMTWGLFGLGTVLDAFTIPRMVDEENMLETARRRGLIPGAPALMLTPGEPPVPPEKQILRLAAGQGGMVTPQMVALHTSLSLADARRELGKLTADGHCDVQVGDDGSEQYRFAGLVPSSKII